MGDQQTNQNECEDTFLLVSPVKHAQHLTNDAKLPAASWGLLLAALTIIKAWKNEYYTE